MGGWLAGLVGTTLFDDTSFSRLDEQILTPLADTECVAKK
jgi:hypothetical protein